MDFRYSAALALTLALGSASPAPARPHPKPAPAAASATARDLYSIRALRRAKIILQLKLLELRAQHLDRVRRAVERRIPVEELLKS